MGWGGSAFGEGLVVGGAGFGVEGFELLEVLAGGGCGLGVRSSGSGVPFLVICPGRRRSAVGEVEQDVGVAGLVETMPRSRARLVVMKCRLCGVDRGDGDFSDHGLRRRECRPCVSERNRRYGAANKARRNERLREWRRRNPDAAKAKDLRARLMRKYGLTPEQVADLRTEQGERCLLCDSEDRDLVVDHCHRTGRVRGLLCRSCNTIVGQVERAPTIQARLVDYLDHGNTTSGLAS